MSRLAQMLAVMPSKYERCETPEVVESFNHHCPRCNGAGSIATERTGYDSYKHDTCMTCKGTGRIKAKVTTEWSADLTEYKSK